MTKKATGGTPKTIPKRPGLKQGRGGVYVDGKRVEWTKPASTEAHDKRVAEREARKAGPVKEAHDV